MNKTVFRFTALVATALVSGCQLATPIAPGTPVATPVPIAPPPVEEPPLPTEVPAATVTPTVAPTVASTPEPAPSANAQDGCVKTYDAAVDYFPEKASVKDAVGFKVEYFKNYKVVTVLIPWAGATETFRYVLVQCGTPTPAGFEGAQVVEVPAKTAIAMSTTELPALEQIGVLDRLVALDSFLWTNNAKVREMIKAGKLIEIGTGPQVDVEKTINAKPDVIFASGSGVAEYDTHPKLLEAKLAVAIDGSYMEQSPLARAEWSKFIALFFNKEAVVEKTHAEIAAQYRALAEKARAATNKPVVLLGVPQKDDWYMAGGKSYMAQLLADAGAAYPWSDDASTGALPLKFEQVLDKAATADIWLVNAFGVFTDTQAIVALDPRLGEFAAAKSGALWNNDLQVNVNGGNAYYESGAANPQLMLADLISIVHPELLPDQKPVFHRKLAK